MNTQCPKAAHLLIRKLAALGMVAILTSGTSAYAQALSVLPVNIQMAPSQSASTLTVTNHGERETSIQIHAYAWDQNGGDDKLSDSTGVLVIPSIATLPAGGSLVVRVVLRNRPQAHEATYRIVLDQAPPPAEAGAIHIALRLSIPVFVQPTAHTVAHVTFRVERSAGKAFLVATNDGARHEAVRDIVLFTRDGSSVKAVSATPYVLSGATKCWALATGAVDFATQRTLRLTARADSGDIEQRVHIVRTP